MTTLAKYMKKITAVALATIAFSLPLASVASAHERNDNPPPPRHEDRYDRHDRHDNNSHNDKHYKYDRKYKNSKHSSYVSKSSSNRKAATSFLVGAAIGAIVAKNT